MFLSPSCHLFVHDFGQHQEYVFNCYVLFRYPFNDQNPLALFSKILQGHYYLPDDLSSHAKCMIRNLLRKDPFERLTAEDLLAHPWFAESEDIIDKTGSVEVFDEINNDQIVPSAN